VQINLWVVIGMAYNIDEKGNPICPFCKVKFDENHHIFKTQQVTEIMYFPSLELSNVVENGDKGYICGECNAQFSDIEMAKAILEGKYDEDDWC
jgi:hypothetical protein